MTTESHSRNYKVAVVTDWNKKRDGKQMKQTVYHIPNGKRKNGKDAVMSVTKHEPR